jgi:hypothetical protein
MNIDTVIIYAVFGFIGGCVITILLKIIKDKI